MNRTQQESEGRLVRIPVDSVTLEADLVVPEGAEGIVLFAHGSGSSRHSPRNRFVADALQDRGLATLLIDLLTPREKEIDMRTREIRFDIDRLARRVTGATDWLLGQPEVQHLNVGYFGSSTGAAAALIAAAERPDVVAAVVSRGGRADMAGDSLIRVEAPTLLIVGGKDYPVIELNRRAMAALETEKKLEIVSGAGHLFEAPGALEEVARLARQWFVGHLVS